MNIPEELYKYILPAGFSLSYFIVSAIVIKFLKLLDVKRNKENRLLISPIVNKHLIFWAFLASIMTFLPIINPEKRIDSLIEKIVLILFIVSLTSLTESIISGIISKTFKKFTDSIGSVSLIFTVGKITVYTTGVLLIFHVIGISITPILTALGVGGLAVALALQDTLSNLFSGIHIIFTGQLRVGDYIKLDEEDEGYIIDINWRNTTIKQISNNMIIIPNSKIVSSKLINYYLPKTELSIYIDVGVSYESDLEYVEEVTKRVAKEIMEQVEGGVKDFDPYIRYKKFGDSSIDFIVILKAKEYTNQYKIRHEFIKRLHKKYKETGIDIPFPITTVYLKNNVVSESGNEK